jgi:hypothetical protein
MPIPHSNRGRVGMGFSPASDGTLQDVCGEPLFASTAGSLPYLALI